MEPMESMEPMDRAGAAGAAEPAGQVAAGAPGAGPVLAVFPEPGQVFAEPAGPAGRCLLPLASIDLGAVRPEWSGRAHLVSPVEPEDGYLGEYTEEFHTAHCRTNWIGFRLDEHDRYTFLADWRYFQQPAAEGADADGFAARVHADYARRKALHTEHGKLLETRWMDRQPLADVLARPLDVVERIGGTTPGWPNWAENKALPLVTDDPEDIHPVSEEGRRYHHVATTVGWHWREGGADRIVMFYEPASRTVLFTFDWS